MKKKTCGVGKVLSILILTMFVLLPSPSCNSNLDYFNCVDCTPTKPKDARVKFQITFDEENQTVPITVYIDLFDDGIVAFRDTLTAKKNYTRLETEKNYTIVAEYKRNGKSHYVVNGAKLTVLKEYERCVEPCYYIVGKTVDLKLRY